MMKPLNKFEIGLVSLTYNSERERKERGKCVIVKDLSGSGVLRACCTRSAHRQQLHHLFYDYIFTTLIATSFFTDSHFVMTVVPATTTPGTTMSSATSTSPASPHQMALLDTSEFSQTYRVDHVLGKGGFGTVYSGVRLRDGLPVAVKHIHKSSVNSWGHVSCLYFHLSERGKKPEET